MGQVVERKIHRGKRNHKYKAFAQVYVLDNEELTDIDNRIILISNEGSFEDIVIGKYGQFKIIQVLKTCYLAVLESIVGE